MSKSTEKLAEKVQAAIVSNCGDVNMVMVEIASEEIMLLLDQQIREVQERLETAYQKSLAMMKEHYESETLRRVEEARIDERTKFTALLLDKVKDGSIEMIGISLDRIATLKTQTTEEDKG